jgi:DNA-binding CsgD family transcriptional regulator
VGFRSLTESIDTTSPAGRLVFHLFGALSEFEAALVRERTMAGLAAARARGRRGGGPPSMTAEKLAVARQMHAGRQHTVAEIARVLGVSRATVHRHLAASADRPGPVPSDPPAAQPGATPAPEPAAAQDQPTADDPGRSEPQAAPSQPTADTATATATATAQCFYSVFSSGAGARRRARYAATAATALASARQATMTAVRTA